MNKPRDMLEFFRRSTPEQADAPSPPPPSLEPTTRMLVLRRSQAIVVVAAAGAALVLAFVLGLAIGGAGGDAPGLFVIRAVSYADDAQGNAAAQKVKEQIEKLDLGEEVHVLESDGRTVVAVGSWLSDPQGRKEARALRDRLRALKNATQAAPFADADFVPMKR
ncbi:MAG TPA: hypothetical protein VFY93_09145 [Planctomycetota bacterium]|nr:hypothetical protein [Planctomycetota bacterium]